MRYYSSVTAAKTIDRQLICALLLATIVIIPRSILIIHAQSPCVDDNYHLGRGLLLLRLEHERLHEIQLNDPPLGEAIVAIPAWLNGIHMPDPLRGRGPFGDAPPPPADCFMLPESIRIETAIWQSMLFLPVLAVIFQWVRSIYSVRSAWLALAMVLSEPTLAAHLPLPTLDVLGMSGIVIASWASWRAIINPTPARRLAAAAAIALALLLKHTALILPLVVVVLAGIHWLLKLQLNRNLKLLRHRVAQLIVTAAAVPTLICIFMLGDFAPPALGPPFQGPSLFLRFLNTHPMPCGLYLKSVATGLIHAQQGHPSYLLGQVSRMGWWYYFPVVAAYKIPLGIAGILFLGLISLLWIKPRYEETPLLVCGVAWTTSLMMQSIDIGFRHFLPAEIFWLMLASRCVAGPRFWPTIIAWTFLAIAFIHVTLWTPNDLSYLNFPRRAAYLDISDSNIDWGQGLKQLRQWIDSQPPNGKDIYVAYFGPPDLNIRDQIGPRPIGYSTPNGWLLRTPTSSDTFTTQMPNHGWLILSPIFLTGQYQQVNRFAFLQSASPTRTIGQSLLVYDLDSFPIRQKQP